MFKLMSLTALILSLSMPLWAGEGDDNGGTPTTVPAKAPDGGEGKMVDIPLDDGRREKGPKKEKKKDDGKGSCTLF